jgi:mono/diheme cytochrome c family protein
MLLRNVVILLCLTLLAACSNLAPSATPTLTPLESQGRIVFESYCSRCHGTSGETVIVGPSLAGIATRGSQRIDGMDAAAYIRNSIEDPSAYTVIGFPEGVMPADLKDQLSSDDLDAVITYLLTLK